MMLAKAKVSLWQILPLGPTGFGDSPYAARSTFAGNELLIDLRSLDQMFEIGKTYQDPDNRTTGRVDYPYVYEKKMPLLKEAAQLFIDCGSSKASDLLGKLEDMGRLKRIGDGRSTHYVRN